MILEAFQAAKLKCFKSKVERTVMNLHESVGRTEVAPGGHGLSSAGGARTPRPPLAIQEQLERQVSQ